MHARAELARLARTRVRRTRAGRILGAGIPSETITCRAQATAATRARRSEGSGISVEFLVEDAPRLRFLHWVKFRLTNAEHDGIVPSMFERSPMPHPSTLHPDLSDERLTEVSRILEDVRREVAAAHQPDAGDGPWGFGCRAHERSCYALTMESATLTWLSASGDFRDFSFRIGEVPMRFFRGAAHKPSSRTLRQTVAELAATKQLSLLPPTADEADLFWRLALETDEEGRLLRAVLVRTNAEGKVPYQWEIPLTSSVAVPSEVRPEQDAGRDLGAPQVAARSAQPSKQSAS